ncbi:hypothetical protein D5F01_LYC02453 [Larimichthys crocea]|uniref:Uncharacterized protein n=1 Tax=Larimichthys crocea TaxID=215358 RepID=A0A6G0J2N8_LARCR|nr:hypothetical protein D5F01_LYC02453 [Larimichthys crocea]
MDSNHETSARDSIASSEVSRSCSASAKSSVKAASKASSQSSSKYTSQRSSSTRSSVIEAAARASAEAALAKAAYVKKQQEIKKESARLDLEKATLQAEIEVLESEKEAAAARAKAEILEATAAIENDDIHSVRSTIPPQVVQQRTEEYVQTQFNIQSLAPLHNALLHYEENPTLKTSPIVAEETSTCNVFTPSVVRHAHTAHHMLPPSSPNRPVKQDVTNHSPSPSPPDNQQRQHNQHSPHHTLPPMIDFAKFLARRELVTTGLSKFDDTPESFRACQSFLNATRDIGLTYGEQLDLLVKWLGKESSEHIKRIRAAHATNPQAALELSWNRLEECYAFLPALITKKSTE